MWTVAYALVALVVACGIAAIELVTSRYPQTYFVLSPRLCWELYVYSLVYGVIAFLVTLEIGSLTTLGTVRLEGLGLGNPWVQAIAVGIAIKAFLHIRLFTATVGSQSVPIGVETIVQLFEPWLLRQVEIKEFNGVREFLEPKAKVYSDIEAVRQLINANVPGTLPLQERIAFTNDVNQAESVLKAMDLYLHFLGRMSFDRVFH